MLNKSTMNGSKGRNDMKKERSYEEEIADTRAEISSEGIYADLGFKDYKEMETKADLVMEISNIIKKKKLTQKQAATKFGITQPKLSELLNGHFRGYSIERLMYFLGSLRNDIEIVIKPTPKNRDPSVTVSYFISSSIKRRTRSAYAK